MGALATTSDRTAVGLLAGMQGGCIATWQLRFLGLAVATIARIVSREGWAQPHAGVMRLPGVAETPLAIIWAAVLALSPQHGPAMADVLVSQRMDPLDAAFNVARKRAVVTGMSAAWLRKLIRTPSRIPHLLVATEIHLIRAGIEITRGSIERDMWSWVDGLAVATGPRLLWDAAWTRRRVRGYLHVLVDVTTTADRLRVMAVDELLAVVEEPVLYGFPGRAPRLMGEVCEALRPGFSHSKTEALARQIAMEVAGALGVLAEPRPYAIRSGAQILAEADIAVVDLRWDAEIDGPHHLLLSQQARDRRRDGRLAPVDWGVDRYPTSMIDESERAFEQAYRRDLRAVIDRRS